MRITVTKEFASPEEAAAWLNIFAGGPINVNIVTPPTSADSITAAASSITPTAPTPTEKPKRKPRSDAGQPRGSYKLSPEEQEKALRDAAGNKEDDAARQRLQEERNAAARESVKTAAPEPAVAQAQEAQRAEPSTPAAADPTMDDARGALGLLNETPGLGMPACMQHLQEFGVNRISLLPKEKFAIFIKQAKEKVAEHKAAAK